MADEAQAPVEAPADDAPVVEQSEAVDAPTPEALGEVVTPTEADPIVDDSTTMVEIYDPATAGNDTALVTLGAYREVWAAKGWRVVVATTDDGSLVLEPVLKLDPEGDGSDGDDGGSTGPTADAEASAGVESDAGPRGRRKS